MAKSKIAITVDSEVLDGLDALVKTGRYANRSRAFEVAAQRELDRANRTRLARACSRLNPAAERAMADEGLAADAEHWPAN
jgi:metal-responsive CopG/Arc/MetJ family transcriptional regulator